MLGGISMEWLKDEGSEVEGDICGSQIKSADSGSLMNQCAGNRLEAEMCLPKDETEEEKKSRKLRVKRGSEGHY
jgi:hypothetical protein